MTTLQAVGGTKRKRVDGRPAKVKANAVGIAMVEGVTAASRETGIPKQTIDYWLDKPEFGHLRTTAREVVVAELWVGIQVGIKALTEGLAGDAPVHQKAQAFEALAERYALLNGEPTSRSETHAVTAGMDDHEKAALRAVLDQALSKVEA